MSTSADISTSADMWGRLQPAAGFSPPKVRTWLRLFRLRRHYDANAIFEAPSAAPLCNRTTAVCHISATRQPPARADLSQGIDEFWKGICVYGPAARKPPRQSDVSAGAEYRPVRGRCDSARWQQQLHSACVGRHAEPRSSVNHAPVRCSEAVAEAEGFDRAASQPIDGPNGAFLAGGELRPPSSELERVWPHRKLYRSKPGASRVGSISGRISMVKRFEMGRAEARCRLKPAPQTLRRWR